LEAQRLGVPSTERHQILHEIESYFPVNLSSIMHALRFAKTGSQQVHAGNSSTFHFALQTKAACEKS